MKGGWRSASWLRKSEFLAQIRWQNWVKKMVDQIGLSFWIGGPPNSETCVICCHVWTFWMGKPMVLGHSTFLKRPDDHWQGEEVVVVLYAGGAFGAHGIAHWVRWFAYWKHLKTVISNLKLPEGSHHYSVKMANICRYIKHFRPFCWWVWVLRPGRGRSWISLDRFHHLVPRICALRSWHLNPCCKTWSNNQTCNINVRCRSLVSTMGRAKFIKIPSPSWPRCRTPRGRSSHAMRGEVLEEPRLFQRWPTQARSSTLAPCDGWEWEMNHQSTSTNRQWL